MAQESAEVELYGRYEPFDHKKALVLDRELDLYAPLDYVVGVGSSNRVYQTVSSSTQASVQSANFTLQTTLETLLNAQPLFQGTVQILWGGGVTVAKTEVQSVIFGSGALFLRQFPIARACNNLQFIIGGTTLSQNTQAIAPILLKCYRNLMENKSLGVTPTFPDTTAQYFEDTASSLSVRMPNSLAGEHPVGESGRNIFDFQWSFVETANPPTANCLGLRITLLEPPLLDIFSMVRDGKKCLSGLNNYQWIYNFAAPSGGLNTSPLSNIFSVIEDAAFDTSAGPSTMGAEFAAATISWAVTPNLLTVQYSQHQRFKLYNAYSYPYLDTSSGYQAQSPSQVPPNLPAKTATVPYPVVSVTSSMNANTITQIPKYFIIWFGLNPAFVDVNDADWLMVPQQISMRFGNNQNLLSSALPHELYQLSVKNGLMMSWSLAQEVGFPLILSPSDLGLQSQLLVEGVIGSFQLEIQSFVATTPSTLALAADPVSLANLQIQMIPAYSSELQIVNNRANLVSVAKMDAAAVPTIPFVDTGNWEQDSPLRGGSASQFLKGLADRARARAQAVVRHVAHAALPYAEAAVARVRKASGGAPRPSVARAHSSRRSARMRQLAYS